VILGLALGLVAPPAATAARESSARQVMGELLRRIRASGRAEAAFVRSVPDPLAGGRREARGRIAIEPPDRVEVSFPKSGERIVLRDDGGEWLQPQLRQLLRLGPERAAGARRWSRMLLVEAGSDLVVRRLTPGHFLVVARDARRAAPDSAWVGLAATGLPERLEILEEADERTVYHFSGWRFTRPRGRAAFVIEPPPDHEVVRLP
jgi:outer membrane lipoprotein-sorting protein